MYAKRMNMAIRRCVVCGDFVTIEHYPKAGIRSFDAYTGDAHVDCTSPELSPMTERDYIWAAKPVQKEN